MATLADNFSRFGLSLPKRSGTGYMGNSMKTAKGRKQRPKKKLVPGETELRLGISGPGSKSSPIPTSGPELIIALTGAVGTDIDRIVETITAELAGFSYRAQTIHLIEELHQIKRWSALGDETIDERYTSHMDAGNEFRKLLGRRDAMALLATSYISKLRAQATGDSNVPSPRSVYILRSVKKPAEINTLRRIYGDNLFVLGIYAPEDSRIDDLAKKIASSHGAAQSKMFEPQATELVQRDQEETNNEYGQNVRGAFPLADFFIDVSDAAKITVHIQRVLNLIFGTSIETPTRDEYGMFLAHAAGLRSASLGRQVGCCICADDGAVMAVGCNEVPKAGGGLYWTGDQGDQRDHIVGVDSNDQIKRQLLQDVLGRIKDAGWLIEEKSLSTDVELLNEALQSDQIRDAKLMDIIDYGRAVHAEMSALIDAARHGMAVRDCTLYATTFPCHNCAKHLLAAGIKRVVYVEAYAKSFVSELFSDSVAIDQPHPAEGMIQFQPFVGVSPRKYLSVFSMGELIRKKEGKVFVKQKNASTPRFATPAHAYLVSEKQQISVFRELLQEKGLEVEDEYEWANK
ncbi:MAG: hypothetical protein V7609_2913 [Verrucomicrobiota bacterium]